MKRLISYLKKKVTKEVGLEKENLDYGVTRTKYRCRKCNNIFLDSNDGYNEHFSLYKHYPIPGINTITHVKKLFTYKYPLNLIFKSFFDWINIEEEELRIEAKK